MAFMGANLPHYITLQ